jgi:hypothetical protein
MASGVIQTALCVQGMGEEILALHQEVLFFERPRELPDFLRSPTRGG